jgi:ankyrin repeat protein
MSRRTVGAAILWLGLAVPWSCGGASQPEEKQSRETSAPSVNLAAEQALREASLKGQTVAMAAAVEQGARIDAADGDRRTALMYAAFNGHAESVRWLLDRGAAVGAQDNVGRTALMFASTGPFSETVRLLLEFGSNPNQADEYEGWTPIMFAAGEGQLEVIEILLDHGADPSAVDKDGQVAADHAAANNHPQVEDALRVAMR